MRSKEDVNASLLYLESEIEERKHEKVGAQG